MITMETVRPILVWVCDVMEPHLETTKHSLGVKIGFLAIKYLAGKRLTLDEGRYLESHPIGDDLRHYLLIFHNGDARTAFRHGRLYTLTANTAMTYSADDPNIKTIKACGLEF